MEKLAKDSRCLHENYLNFACETVADRLIFSFWSGVQTQPRRRRNAIFIDILHVYAIIWPKCQDRKGVAGLLLQFLQVSFWGSVFSCYVALTGNFFRGKSPILFFGDFPIANNRLIFCASLFWTFCKGTLQIGISTKWWGENYSL